MTLTTRIRFTEPVDPRHIWERVQAAIGAPDGYTWQRRPANDEIWGANPSFVADSEQGAGAWAMMFYGPEGSRLVDAWEEYPVGTAPPPAYVEVTLINGRRERHPQYLAAITCGLPAAWQDDYTGEWFTA